jgi:tetratricopeptide (TPR) repeat protein
MAEAHAAMGQVVTQLDRDLEAGRAHYRRALELRPDLALAHAYLALSLTMGGRIAEAQASIARAQRLEPASIPFNSIGGLIAYFGRSYGEAQQRLASIVRSMPEAPLPRHFLARALLVQGRSEEVLALLEGRNEPAPGVLSNLGRALAMSGRREQALAEVARLEALGARGFGVGFDLSLLHLALGDHAAALAALERAIGDHSQTGAYVDVEPALDPLRGDERFRAISAGMRRS